MEGIGTEVSHKIRAAIKAKLIELGAYVDDELPDYIMVMVANKRTRSQMDEDLQLFLTSNTKIFTSWLHTVLQKLQEVTVASFGKKETESKKLSKRKKSESDGRSRNLSEEVLSKVKKHSKKHKEGKKTKKNKHKSKEKSKLKSGKKEEKDDEKEKVSRSGDDSKTSQDIERNSEKKSKNEKIQLNEAVGKAILGNLKSNEKLKSEFSSWCSSSSDKSSNSNEKEERENGNGDKNPKLSPDHVETGFNKKAGEVEGGKKIRKELIEDEFNIGPLKAVEKSPDFGSVDDEKPKESCPEVQTEKTISAPTEELLKQHNKLQRQKLEGEEENEKKRKTESDSDESLSPEEIRKQLLLSRAKKKLEESKLADRMKSNSPDVMIVKETKNSEEKEKELPPSSRRSRSPGISQSEKPNSDYKSKQSSNYEDRPRMKWSRGRSPSPRTFDREAESKSVSTAGDRKRNVIKISESLKLEKNLGVKKEADYGKAREKESTFRKRPVSSRVVTISDPESPEIPSVVKIKPREYVPKDKQANKALILKAVADAEKSVATVHNRTEPEPDTKKLEALFTRNLREKRYEKLAVTLSNIRKSPDSRERKDKRISVDSEKSDRSRVKHDSSEVSEGLRGRSDVLSMKKLSRSDDQFISSKTTVMEKNDKYIRCWLEGVEKAVKDDEMVNPSEMEDLVNCDLTEEENEFLEGELSKEERKLKRPKLDETEAEKPAKNQKLSEKEMANLRVVPNSSSNDEGPQIVVTLDGLNSKTIKDIILRNKEGMNGPLLSAASRKSNEKETKVVTQRLSKPKSPPRKSGFEKISDRFGRLNKTSEGDERGRGEKKESRRRSVEREKKEKGSAESKNRQLIAQLSEKFGKVDREFEDKKRRYPEDRRYGYESRRSERNGKYKKSEWRSMREGGFGFSRGS